MKHLSLQNQKYIQLREEFRSYLKTLGYAKSTVYNLPHAINELFHYLEQNNVSCVLKMTDSHLNDFWNELQQRPNERRGGGLSTAYLKKYDQAIKLFTQFLNSTRNLNLNYNVELPNHEAIRNIVILTRNEIQMIYYQIDDSIMGMRDKAMMAIYYGCGLRRSEGEKLDARDIQLDSNRIYVREGKGYKDRLVPMAKRVSEDVRQYLIQSRPKLQKQYSDPAFFINEKGRRLSGQMMYVRLKQLTYKTPITKTVGLHTLRHSIATHLLQQGMSLEMIGKFLGHSSLEATQIYTHIINEKV